jgi:hypothetical protein
MLLRERRRSENSLGSIALTVHAATSICTPPTKQLQECSILASDGIGGEQLHLPKSETGTPAIPFSLFLMSFDFAVEPNVHAK